MKTVQIHEIEFNSSLEANETSNYPHGGLFFSRIKNHHSDLRFVDKKTKVTSCIVPEEIFHNITAGNIIAETFLETEFQSNKYDGDFILKFSRILLNRK